MFFWATEAAPGIRVAFTNRTAGNLATHVGSDPDAVSRSRSELERGMRIARGSLCFMNQTHSTDVAEAVPGTAPAADALVSSSGAAALAVLVADCVPVVLVGFRDDSVASTAVVHAGRAGVEGNIVGRAVGELRKNADAVSAWIGPSICGSCYEVPAELRDRVSRDVPSTFSTTSWGTAALDLPAGVRSQLAAAGVQVGAVGTDEDLCTLENDRLFSHRAVASGRPEGRIAGLVWCSD